MNRDAKVMGYEQEDDKKFSMPIRNWDAIKRALWRSRVAWEIAVRAAAEIVERCVHDPDCPGKTVETEPCLKSCRDREQRMSALVVLNAARQFAPLDARKPADAPYFAPSREYFTAVLAELAAVYAELEVLRSAAGVEMVVPPPIQTTDPPQLKEAT